MITYISIVAISVAFSILFAKYDAARIKIKNIKRDRTNLDHNFRTYVRVNFCLLLGGLAGSFIGFLISLSAFYLVFDLWMNKERGKDIFYLGHTSKVDRFLIKLFHEDVKKAGKAMFALESLLLILWTYLYAIFL